MNAPERMTWPPLTDSRPCCTVLPSQASIARLKFSYETPGDLEVPLLFVHANFNTRPEISAVSLGLISSAFVPGNELPVMIKSPSGSRDGLVKPNAKMFKLQCGNVSPRDGMPGLPSTEAKFPRAIFVLHPVRRSGVCWQSMCQDGMLSTGAA
jgi:hypothetical protein